jgi:hypothetical protein
MRDLNREWTRMNANSKIPNNDLMGREAVVGTSKPSHHVLSFPRVFRRICGWLGIAGELNCCRYVTDGRRSVKGGGVFKGKERTDVETYLNELGKDGWDIINLDFRELESRFEFSGAAKREVTA